VLGKILLLKTNQSLLRLSQSWDSFWETNAAGVETIDGGRESAWDLFFEFSLLILFPQNDSDFTFIFPGNQFGAVETIA
jgi:hypothetical protein